MRKLSFKKMVPALALTIGMAGAFATMSMKEAPNSVASTIGFAKNIQGQPCQLQVNCSSVFGTMCRVSYPSGEIAYDKPGTVCLQPLYRQ